MQATFPKKLKCSLSIYCSNNQNVESELLKCAGVIISIFVLFTKIASFKAEIDLHFLDRWQSGLLSILDFLD